MKKTRKNKKPETFIMTPELERILGPIEDDIKNGRNLSPSFSSVEEMVKYLHSR